MKLYIFTFLLGFLACLLIQFSVRKEAVRITDGLIPSALIENHKAGDASRHREIEARGIASIADHETASGDADEAWSREARLQDTRRLVEEDTRVLAKTLTLSDEQVSWIANQLEQIRLASEASPTTEYDVVVSVLTPEQRSAYERHLEHQRHIDAEQLALLRTYAIERVTGPLSELQRAQVYNAIAASLISMEAVSEDDILKGILDESKYNLWSQSSAATAVLIDK